MSVALKSLLNPDPPRAVPRRRRGRCRLQAASRMAQEEAMRAGELRGLPTVFGELEAA